jgi:DNA helicase-2/ATP-dependent DNA helicase PcrA
VSGQTEHDDAERQYLARTLRLLTDQLRAVTASIDSSSGALDESKRLMWENRRDMDGAEKAALRTVLDVAVQQGENTVAARGRLNRLLDTPYFGRVDFRLDHTDDRRPYYVGVHGLRDPDTGDLVVHDWRAPVSSLYYDFESGEASFEAPDGIVHGEITGKRQYKITNGRMQYMLETTLNIGDDILQQELNRSADEKMKNIVATIQREQNAIIRNETARVLILQGVAGSGKTSIALHRVAFLLYRFKDTLSSDNVMILSPNRIFGDYIADVLPELGEEQIAEIDFDKIAGRYLRGVCDYETFSEQVSALLDKTDDAAVKRISYKATTGFVAELDEWMRSCEAEFVAGDIEHRGERVSADEVAQRFRALGSMPILTRVAHLGDAIAASLKQRVVDRSGRWAASDSAAVRKQVRTMFPYRDAFALYRAFYATPARQGLFKTLSRKKVEYADVFPLVYTMIATSRQENYRNIRHLIVDEMQDYTPIQYAVLGQLFSCPMTILGDSHQAVNPFSSSSLSTIHEIFPDADCLELHKSYRSTTEITDFAQHISRNDKLVAIERHGQAPSVTACADDWEQVEQITELIDRCRRNDYRSLAVICKTAARAEKLYSSLTDAGAELTLLDHDSTAFAAGVVITSAHISKGLEFDMVVVPDVDSDTYANAVDKSMLYIACTRAMHELHLTHYAERSPHLQFVQS